MYRHAATCVRVDTGPWVQTQLFLLTSLWPNQNPKTLTYACKRYRVALLENISNGCSIWHKENGRLSLCIWKSTLASKTLSTVDVCGSSWWNVTCCFHSLKIPFHAVHSLEKQRLQQQKTTSYYHTWAVSIWKLEPTKERKIRHKYKHFGLPSSFDLEGDGHWHDIWGYVSEN